MKIERRLGLGASHRNLDNRVELVCRVRCQIELGLADDGGAGGRLAFLAQLELDLLGLALVELGVVLEPTRDLDRVAGDERRPVGGGVDAHDRRRATGDVGISLAAPTIASAPFDEEPALVARRRQRRGGFHTTSPCVLTSAACAWEQERERESAYVKQKLADTDCSFLDLSVKRTTCDWKTLGIDSTNSLYSRSRQVSMLIMVMRECAYLCDNNS